HPEVDVKLRKSRLAHGVGDASSLRLRQAWRNHAFSCSQPDRECYGDVSTTEPLEHDATCAKYCILTRSIAERKIAAGQLELRMKAVRLAFCSLLPQVVAVALGFTQASPVPLINNPLVPTSVRPGGGAFTLTVNGTGFVAGSVVNWNRVSLTTT